MGLRLMRDAKGNVRRIWYGRLTRNGRKVDVRLDTPPVKGEIPLTPNGTWDKAAKGDETFEKSRAAAQAAFLDLIDSDKKKRQTVRQLEIKLFAAQGLAMSKTPLSSLFDKYLAKKGDRIKSDRHAAKVTFSHFAAFAENYTRSHGGKCTTLEEVSPEMALAYFRKLEKVYAWGTVLDKFHLLRGAWKRWSQTRTIPNPFDSVDVRRDKDNPGRISRIPLTAEEARRLFTIVKDRAPKLYPLTVCAATTGLRLGDASTLKWDEVKIQKDQAKRKYGDHGFIDRITLKTGARVVVPIIQPFADVLESMEQTRADGDVYLFPDYAERYIHKGTRTGLATAIKPYMALAVRPDLEQQLPEAVSLDSDGATNGRKTLDDINTIIDGAFLSESMKAKLKKVAREYTAGMSQDTIAKDMECSQTTIHHLLRKLETLTGGRLRRLTRREKIDRAVDYETLLDITRKDRVRGRYRASIYGWHSLRATYVVLGVEAGVPLPYIEKAVGHTTVSMTMQYFNPTGKHAAAMIAKRFGSTFAPTALPPPDSETIDLDATAATVEATAETAQPTQATPAQSQAEPQPLTADGVWQSLSDEEKKKLRRRLLEEAGLI